MNRRSTINIAFCLFCFLILAASCSVRKEKPERSGLLPEKDFVAVLTDIHIADGLMLIPKIRNLFEQRDSIQNYSDIIKSHGYTTEQMDRTIRYYFIKKPKKLISIYDEVLEKLAELETHYSQIDASIESNFWKGDSVYFFPSNNGELTFDHQFKSFGYYTLSFTLTLYPDDQSVNPHLDAYFCHPDSIESGTRDNITSFNYIKDGRPHKYSFSRKPSSPSYTHLRGNFVDCDNQPLNSERHLVLEDIFLNFLPAAQ